MWVAKAFHFEHLGQGTQEALGLPERKVEDRAEGERCAREVPERSLECLLSAPIVERAGNCRKKRWDRRGKTGDVRWASVAGLGGLEELEGVDDVQVHAIEPGIDDQLHV